MSEKLRFTVEETVDGPMVFAGDDCPLPSEPGKLADILNDVFSKALIRVGLAQYQRGYSDCKNGITR